MRCARSADSFGFVSCEDATCWYSQRWHRAEVYQIRLSSYEWQRRAKQRADDRQIPHIANRRGHGQRVRRPWRSGSDGREAEQPSGASSRVLRYAMLAAPRSVPPSRLCPFLNCHEGNGSAKSKPTWACTRRVCWQLHKNHQVSVGFSSGSLNVCSVVAKATEPQVRIQHLPQTLGSEKTSELLFRGRQQGPTWRYATSERAMVVNTYKSLSTVFKRHHVHRSTARGFGHRECLTGDQIQGA